MTDTKGNKFTTLIKSLSPNYRIVPDDTEATGTSMGYGTELLTLTSDMLNALEQGKLIIVDIQGEYSLVLKIQRGINEN